MPYSMTGWGTYRTQKFTVNIRGVNSKYKEINLHLPQEFFIFEPGVYKLISDSVGRGKVDVFISLDKAKLKRKLRVNGELFKSAYASVKKLLAETGAKEVPVEVIFQGVEGILSEDTGIDEIFSWPKIRQAVGMAVKDFIKMKKTEAGRLMKDIDKRISEVESEAVKIKKLFEAARGAYAAKARQRIEELMGKPQEGSFAKQVIEIADKFDITEELVRISSHVKQARTLSGSDAAGRRLDFIAQEMYREANTLTNKLGSPDISACAIGIKEATDKIREQAANLE